MFFFKKGRASVALLALAMLLSASGLLGLSALEDSDRSIATIYDDRVVVLKQLKGVSDALGREAPLVAWMAAGRDVTAAEAMNRIVATLEFSRENWRTYLSTYLVDDEKRLIAELEPHRLKVEGDVERLSHLLAYGDVSAIEKAIRDLERHFAPLHLGIEKLVDVQLEVTRQELEQSRLRLHNLRLGAFGFIAMGIILATIVGISRSRLQRRLEESHRRIAEEMQKLAETQKAEQTAAARFRAVTMTNLYAIVTFDSSGQIVSWNPGADAIFGWTEPEMIGQPVLKLIPHRLHDHGLYSVGHLTTGKLDALMGQTIETMGVTRHGREFPMELSLSEWATSEGKFFTCIMRDIGKRKATEEQLRKLSLAVEQSSENIVITNQNGRIEYVNESFLRNVGYGWDETIGQNPRFLQSGKTPRAEYERMWAVLKQGQSWKGELFNRRKDGTEYIELRVISPIRRHDGVVTHYVGVGTDVTEVKRMNDELTRHRQHLEELVTNRTQELAEARRVAESASRAKSVFLANMSHEIRTPMNAIIGLTHLLAKSPLNDEQSDRIDKIQSSAKHLLSIINDVLDISKIEAGRMVLEGVDFQISSIVEDVRRLVGSDADRRGLSIDCQLEGLPNWIHGDPTRLRQALLNYAANAIKFSENGRIVIRGRSLEEKGDSVLLRFEVQDFGVGIDPRKMTNLFEMFEQADASTTRKFGGTGLGLAITRRLAELMGGTAGADSQFGKGSTFWFTARFTRAGPMVSPGFHPIASDEAVLRSRVTSSQILLVDDCDINREVASALLQSVSIPVDVAENGRQAIEMIRAKAYDLVLMDIQMPEIDGLAATRVIRATPNRSTTPIVAMTANVYEEDRRACFEAGMNDFISKPVDPEVLFATLTKWLPDASTSLQRLGGDLRARRPLMPAQHNKASTD